LPLKIFDNREEIAALTDAGVVRLCSQMQKFNLKPGNATSRSIGWGR